MSPPAVRKKPVAIPRLSLISMGNCGVGKSCIIKRYSEQVFVSRYSPTIGVDYGEMQMPDTCVALKIVDTSGNPFFFECRNEFYKKVDGVLLGYDVTDMQSFTDLDQWLKELRNHSNTDLEDIAFVVCANKVDGVSGAKRVVSEAEGRRWCQKHRFAYLETSALTGQNIAEVFKTLVEMIKYGQSGKGKPRVSDADLKDSAPLEPTAEQATATEKVMSGNNAYERLGVSRTASKDDIKKVYRKLAMLLHPDKNCHPDADEAFKRLAADKKDLLGE
ncbi:dnaJ homolog subfamily C member 27-like [Sycon ciliatum]|uniref:dnaJ homolog subfamily C member 27-like n=1 Tax=Sycon ciliatum TaxID=27933 RepID=UPI0031F6C084